MSQYGYNKFIDTLSKDTVTELPGGLFCNGPFKVANNNHINEFFDVEPISAAKAGAGEATGTGGNENLMRLNNSQWEYHILGTQSIVSPTLGTYGLNIGMDQADNDGVELCLGINSRNKGVFTVGISPAFFARMKFYIADVSGTDDCAFGFRKVEDYQANIDDYDELACLNVISGDIKVETILNNGETITTDTTDNWADTATHELEVRVSAAGVVSYKIDGLDPSNSPTNTFTFDDEEVVVPFFYFLNASDLAGEVGLIEFECGLQ